MADGFEGLEVYKEARKLRQRMFKLAEQLPKDEKFVLCPQMRRAALSVTNCIAEGHGSFSWKHNISYLYRARGSINELIDDLGACADQSYFKVEHLENLRQDADSVIRLINGYVKHLQRMMDNSAVSQRNNQRKREHTVQSKSPTDLPINQLTD